MVTDELSSNTLTPRRKVTFLRMIMGETLQEDAHDSERGAPHP
jgi:hypothetical protein